LQFTNSPPAKRLNDMNKDAYTKAFLQAAEIPLTEKNIKEYKAIWWWSFRNKAQGGLRLTDQALEFIEKYAKKRFGSGWVWWVIMPSGNTRILETPYQDNPKMYFDCEILLGIDVWEHAYYLKYQSDRAGYIDNIFKVINWEFVNRVLSRYYK